MPYIYKQNENFSGNPAVFLSFIYGTDLRPQQAVFDIYPYSIFSKTNMKKMQKQHKQRGEYLDVFWRW